MNIKTIILGILVVAGLIGLVWYFGQEKPADQEASIINDNDDQEQESAIIEDFVLGDPAAPVTIIDYSSHFCGYCADFHNQTLPLIVDKYVKTGQVKIIPRLLSPLELSMAVLCAHKQGKFVQYNDYLFAHVEEIQAVDDLKTIAADLKLEQEQFNQCFDSKKYEAKAMSWFEQAQEAGIEGTPTFYVNDQEITGNQPYAIFEQAIEQAWIEQ